MLHIRYCKICLPLLVHYSIFFKFYVCQICIISNFIDNFKLLDIDIPSIESNITLYEILYGASLKKYHNFNISIFIGLYLAVVNIFYQ